MPDEEIYFWSSDENSEWGEIRTNAFRVNQNSNKRFWVVDNFFEDPLAVRNYALAQTYYPGEGAVGSRTRKQFFFKGMVEKFEEIMQRKFSERVSMDGTCLELMEDFNGVQQELRRFIIVMNNSMLLWFS